MKKCLPTIDLVFFNAKFEKPLKSTFRSIGAFWKSRTYDAAGKQIAEYSTIVADTNDARVAYLTNDHLGSPRINTDADGDITARHDYHPFGEEISTAERTTHEEYTPDTVRKQFTGYERDDESGLDFAQARVYSSFIGRFFATDPIFLRDTRFSDPQRSNLYVYCRNSPLIFVDMLGEDIVLSSGMTQGQLDALVDSLVDAYMTTGGNQFLNDMADSTESTLTLGVGDLSSTDEPGRVTYGLTTVTAEGDISMTFDLDRRDAMEERSIKESNEDRSSGRIAGTGSPRTVTVRPDSAKEIGKHEIAHGIDAKKDPNGYRAASEAGKKISDISKKPDEIRRKAIQKTDMAENVKGLKKDQARDELKKLLGYDSYTPVTKKKE